MTGTPRFLPSYVYVGGRDYVNFEREPETRPRTDSNQTDANRCWLAGWLAVLRSFSFNFSIRPPSHAAASRRGSETSVERISVPASGRLPSPPSRFTMETFLHSTYPSYARARSYAYVYVCVYMCVYGCSGVHLYFVPTVPILPMNSRNGRVLNIVAFNPPQYSALLFILMFEGGKSCL